MSDKHVQLDRRFAPFSEDVVTEDVIVRSFSESSSFSRSTLSWDDILQRRLNVVLGEPGSGKTAEFRRRAGDLYESGEAAFFIPLESLVRDDLRSALSDSREQRFKEWLISGDNGVFFLDSVDESKLVKSSDFEVALRRFAKDVTSNGMKRATIVLSCRVSKWSPEMDTERVARCLEIPVPPPEVADSHDEGSHTLNVVRILPLDKTMVERLLKGCGFENVSQILSQFDDYHLWRFVRRPVDAIRYATSVNADVELGSLIDVLDHDIARRLQESPDRNQQDLLTKTQALDGARTLAAALVFARCSALLVADWEDDNKHNAIDPVQCFSTGWSPSEVQSLVNRPLFDGASQGTIRFHDPRVRDVLAAQWLQDRSSQGCSMETIKELLCADLRDGFVVREGMQAVLAWVACADSRLAQEARTWILRASPELLFSHGDAGNLPIEYRQQLLEAYIARFGDRDYTWTVAEPECLTRFAEHSLEADVTGIATDTTICEDVRLLTLWLMRHGRLRGCLSTALALATDERQSIDIRTSAMAVIRDVPDDATLGRLAQYGRDARSIPEKLLGIMIEALFPADANAHDVATFAEKTKSTFDSKEGASRFHWLASHFEERLSSRDALNLLIALISLAERKPLITLNDTPLRLSDTFQWLGPWFPALLGNAIRESTLNHKEIDVVARAWAWLEEFSTITNRLWCLPDHFIESTRQHPDLRRAYFWLRYDDYVDREAEEPRIPHQFLGFRSHHTFATSTSDMAWLLADVEQQTDTNRRNVALTTWIDIWEADDRSSLSRNKARSAVAGDNLLLNHLEERIRRARFPRLRQFWYGTVCEKFLDRYWWSGHWRSLKERWRRFKYALWLHTHTRALRLGQYPGVLSALAREAIDLEHSTWMAPMTWDRLRAKRGRRIANAVSDGCHQVWLQYEPQLPHERAVPNSYTTGDRAGLCGLSTGITSGEIQIESLPDPDIEKAIRYAATELNGLPCWFSQFVDFHADTVRRVLIDAIKGEWGWDNTHISFGVLHDIRWGEQRLRQLLANDIVELLGESEPPDPDMLALALQCLIDAPADGLRQLGELSTHRLDDVTHGTRFSQWFAVEMQLAPSSALNRLESFSAENDRDVETAQELFAALSGEDISPRSRRFQNAQPLSPQQMKRMLLLSHHLIKTVDDVKRQRTHSPTSREYAQRYRDSLIGQLGANESSETPCVLSSNLS